jgi:hypothetical protein
MEKSVLRTYNIDPKIDVTLQDEDGFKPKKSGKKKAAATKKMGKGAYGYNDNNFNSCKRKTAFDGCCLYMKTSRFPSTQHDCPKVLCCTASPDQSEVALGMRKGWIGFIDPMRD